MKKIIYLIFLWMITSYSQLPAYEMKQENALLQRLNAAPNDSTKLTVLYELIRITTDTPERNTHYINILLEEAEKQQNSYYICLAYTRHIVVAFNMYDIEAVYKWNALLEPIARKAKLHSFMFEGRRATIDILNTKGHYMLAEKEAHKMLKESKELNSDIGIAYAYQSLGYVNAFHFNYPLAVDYFEKSYAIFNKQNRIVSVNEVCDRLIDIYSMLNKHPQRLLVIQKQEEILLQQANGRSLGQKEDFLINYLNYLNYYLDIDHLQEAERYLHLVEQYHVEGYLIYEDIYRTARIAYFFKKQQMERAIAEIDTLLKVSSNLNTKNRWEINKAGILKLMGEYPQALMLYKKTWPIKDSLRIDLLEKQTKQLMQDYYADTLLLKKQKTSYIAQLSFIILIALVILILIWFMIHTYRVQRRLSKAKKEQIRLNREMELASIAKEKFITHMGSSIRKPVNSILKDSLLLASYQKLDIEERKVISENISTTSEQLIILINNILELAHLEAKQVKYNLNDIEITSILRGLISEKPDLILRMEADHFIWVRVDNDRLIQVFKRMVERASSETPLSIHLKQVEKETVHIGVSGSLLGGSDPSQDVMISNEMNGMILADFNGTYQVHSPTGSIAITLPVIHTQKM